MTQNPDLIKYLTDNGMPLDWYDLTWQQKGAWLKEFADPDNENHMTEYQSYQEIRFNVQ
jgi:hypothetical protein